MKERSAKDILVGTLTPRSFESVSHYCGLNSNTDPTPKVLVSQFANAISQSSPRDKDSHDTCAFSISSDLLFNSVNLSPPLGAALQRDCAMSDDTISSHFLSAKSIFVIGAGLSGSAFVGSLRRIWNHNLPFPKIVVFDRDPKGAFQRRGGYSLSLVGNDVSGGLVAYGANSKIRDHLRPNDTLEYTGAVLRTAVSRFSGPLPEQVGRNQGFVLSSTGTSCFMSPVGENEPQWAVGHFKDEASTEICDVEHAKRVIQRASELGSHIAEPFKTIVSQTVPGTVMCINAHDKLPFRQSEIGTLPVVLIGDANHALSPFAGYGANLELSDAWDLAEQLARGDSLAEAIATYDDLGFPRATKVAGGSQHWCKVSFFPGHVGHC